MLARARAGATTSRASRSARSRSGARALCQPPLPLLEAQTLGASEGKERLGTLSLKGGPCKSFRIPIETAHLRDDRVVWYCVGDREQIAQRIAWITHLGKRRGVGLGRVHRWEVEPCAPWGEGFP